MGIIKTAMLTGGGLYAINRLAKTAERHHSSPSQGPASNSQDERREFPTDSSRNYQPQQYQPRYDTRDMYDDGRTVYPSQQQQNYSMANDNPYAPLPQRYLEYNHAPAPRPWEAQQPPAREYHASASSSPPYARQQQSGFVLDENEDFAQTQPRSSGTRSLLDHPMAQQAMQFAMGQAGGKGKGDGEGGMGQMLSGLLSK